MVVAGSEKESAAAASLDASGLTSSTSAPTMSYEQRRKQRNQMMQRQQQAQRSDETLQHSNLAEAAASALPPPPPLTNGVFPGITKKENAAQSTINTTTPITTATSTEAEEYTTTAPTPAPAGPAPPPHHRGVSWGGVEELSASEIMAENSTHPSSPAASSTRSAQEVYEAAEAAMEQCEGDRMHHIKGLSSAGKINLDDLMQLHPIENEAETHILRALEQSDIAESMGVNADGIITGEVSFLGHVPEGAEGIFSSPPSEPDGTSDHHQHSTRVRGISVGTDGDEDDQDAPAAYTTPVVDSVWDHSTEPTAVVSSHSSNASTRLSQQPRHQAMSNSSVTTNHPHRRQKTMEQTLSSLTNALEDLHWHNRARPSTIDSKPAPSVNHQHVDPLESSADAFAKNVSVLFRNKTTGTATPNLTSEVEPLISSAGETTTGSVRNQGSAAVDGDNSSSHHDVVESPSEHGDEESQECNSSHFTPPLTPGRSTRARKNWSMLKEAIIQNGPTAALDVGAVHSAGDDNTSGHAISTINEDTDDIETGDSGGGGGGVSPNNLKSSPSGPKPGWLRRMANKVGFVRAIDDFLQPRRASIWVFVKAMLWVILPSFGVAFILFYLGDNPPTGIVNSTSGVLEDENGELVEPTQTSASWWVLFIGVRQLITFSLARFMEGFLVDFICLERRWSLTCFGPTFTLLIVQSKGWPCILFFWSLFDLALLYGEHPLAAHWGYFQSYLDIFTDSNPSGDIVSSALNLRIILMVLGVSCVVAVKRLLIGYHFGRKLFGYYAEDLARVMKKILLISQVASLASQLERERIFEGDQQRESANVKASRVGIDEVVEEEVEQEDIDNDDTKSQGSASIPHSAKSLLFGDRDEDGRPDGILTQAQRNRIDRILGNWDEPDALPNVVSGNISIASILQFRTSMAQLGRPFPFSFAFGRASTREECIESTQNVYLRLLAETPGETSLSFNVVALVALRSDGTLVPEKVRELIRLFRPNRNGSLTMFDFIRSVDAVYKELRLLRASVRNAQKLDQSFERIFNAVFYTVILCVCLAVLGFDPLAVFLSFSSFALAFSFMISRASSNYFEGLLFILARRPYDIGDRIVVQPVEAETSLNGATDWIVKDIDLFTTTISSAYTNEVATVSNGSMANSRIMNGARSPSALLYIILRFGVDVSFGQLEIFREALTRYCEARPREWTKMWCFRAINVQADAGYVEYMVCVEARDSWQELFNLWHIRGQIKAFCHELSKQLDMRYVSPAMPIDLRMRGSLDDALREDQDRRRAITEGITADSELIQSIIQDRRR